MINRISEPYAITEGNASASGVSWGAILAGAFAAAALSFILIILGFGLGFSAISPWAGSGASAQTIGVSTIVWVAFTQIAASAIGGYMAGRLRVKWAGLHTSEVYFRDTAHGLLAWAVASLATAALLTSAIGGVLAGGAKVAGATGGAAVTAAAGAGAGMAGGAMGPGRAMGRMGGMSDGGDTQAYFVDMLFRPSAGAGAGANAGAPGMAADGANAGSAGAGGSGMTGMTGMTGSRGMRESGGEQRAETTRIFLNGLRKGGLNEGDRNYLAQMLAARTGMSQPDATRRVDETYANFSKAVSDAKANAQAAADKARKAAAYSALWMFVALLCGAFIASLCATLGGRLRDRTVMLDGDRGDVYSTTNTTA